MESSTISKRKRPEVPTSRVPRFHHIVQQRVDTPTRTKNKLTRVILSLRTKTGTSTNAGTLAALDKKDLERLPTAQLKKLTNMIEGRLKIPANFPKGDQRAPGPQKYFVPMPPPKKSVRMVPPLGNYCDADHVPLPGPGAYERHDDIQHNKEKKFTMYGRLEENLTTQPATAGPAPNAYNVGNMMGKEGRAWSLCSRVQDPEERQLKDLKPGPGAYTIPSMIVRPPNKGTATSIGAPCPVKPPVVPGPGEYVVEGMGGKKSAKNFRTYTKRYKMRSEREGGPAQTSTPPPAPSSMHHDAL